MISTREIAFVDLHRQYDGMKDEIINAIQKCIDNTAFIGGEEVKKFERAFADYCEVSHCVACGNGTDAIEICLQSIGLNENDEVIVPANSFVASAEAVINSGGKVVFCDIDALTYNIDIEKVKSCITENTKAIIPVHLYGRMAEMDELRSICDQHNIWLIEDGAQSHGSIFKGRKMGYYGDFACVSFYPGKNLGAYGDAGAILVNDEKMYVKTKMIANHGRVKKYDHEIIGRNSRMDTIQAAILNVKLTRLEEWIVKRNQVAKWYYEALEDCKDIVLPGFPDDGRSSFHLYVIRVDKSKREDLMAFLKEKGIATGIHYPIALPALKAFDHLNHTKEDFPIAYQYMDTVLSLPIFPELTKEEVEYVADCIKSFFKTPV